MAKRNEPETTERKPVKGDRVMYVSPGAVPSGDNKDAFHWTGTVAGVMPDGRLVLSVLNAMNGRTENVLAVPQGDGLKQYTWYWPD